MQHCLEFMLLFTLGEMNSTNLSGGLIRQNVTFIKDPLPKGFDIIAEMGFALLLQRGN